MMQRKGEWIQLISGEPFWPLDPRSEEIHITDIAWSLSMQCRFAGHVKRYYSVAEHCLRVSQLVDHELALWGLLHDATEAYLVDLPRPLKHCMPDYRIHEDRLMHVIAERFDLSWPIPAQVHAADMYMLHAEKDSLLAIPRRQWEAAQVGELSEWQPAQKPIIAGMPPEIAHHAYMHRFNELELARRGAAVE